MLIKGLNWNKSTRQFFQNLSKNLPCYILSENQEN